MKGGFLERNVHTSLSSTHDLSLLQPHPALGGKEGPTHTSRRLYLMKRMSSHCSAVERVSWLAPKMSVTVDGT